MYINDGNYKKRTNIDNVSWNLGECPSICNVQCTFNYFGAFYNFLMFSTFLGRGRVAARGLYRRRVAESHFPQISTSFQS